MPVSFAGITLRNPFIPASGCFGYGWEAEEAIGPLFWGAAVTKTVTPLPKEGNPPPRIFETESGIINRIGLQNCGVDKFGEIHLPKLRELPYPFIISVYADSAEGWEKMGSRMKDSGASAIEINLSCPNLRGERFTTDPQGCAAAVETVKKTSGLPVIAKINALDSPLHLSRIVEDAGASAILCSNTLPSGVFLNGEFYRGGLSGPAIKPVALRAVKDICGQTSLDVAACGGISSLSDVEDYRKAGAVVFVLGTVLLKYPDFVNTLVVGDDKNG